MKCDQELDSSDAICECSGQEAQPEPDTGAQTCDEASWPDKDHDLVCGACKVLVDRFNSHYKTCDGYCNEMGRQCVGAWEESDDTCNVLHTMNCDEQIDSSDAICECSADATQTGDDDVCYSSLAQV